MPEQTAPLTVESVLALIRESGLEFKQWLQDSSEKFDQRMEKLDRRMEKTSQEVSALGSRVGEIVENMVGGEIDKQFRVLGYNVTAHSRNKIFGEEGTSDCGEIDLLLENGDIAILIEAKTKLKVDDVHGHIERLEKYRAYLNREGHTDRRQLIGAVAAASAHPEVIKFAQRQGL